MRGVSVKLLFAVVALCVVLMHHVVAAHEHAESAAAQPPSMLADGTPRVSHGGGLVEHAVGDLASALPAVLLHVHHQGGGHEAAMLLHACLAVLAALVALLMVLVLVGWRSGAFAGVLARGVLPDVPVRGPPVPLRLARLQVLRL